MAQLSDKHINQWDLPSWVKKSEGLKGSVELDGVLFAHSDSSRVYFMSEASGPGVRFDLLRSDIVDAVDNGKHVAFGEQAFNGVHIVLKLGAVVTRTSIHLASGLVEYTDHKVINIAGDTMKIKNTVLASVVMR